MPVPYFNPQQFRLQELPVIPISTVVVNGRIDATPILVNITRVLPSNLTVTDLAGCRKVFGQQVFQVKLEQ